MAHEFVGERQSSGARSAAPDPAPKYQALMEHTAQGNALTREYTAARTSRPRRARDRSGHTQLRERAAQSPGGRSLTDWRGAGGLRRDGRVRRGMDPPGSVQPSSLGPPRQT